MEQHQHVLITGGTAGIGFELARQFARNGHSLILVARSLEGLDNASKELSGEFPDIHVHTISKDLFYSDNAFELYNE
ncbi:MAG TPA: SDR family NAD(P)-dependent oxidoreductase, partial [Flavitalea sp.]|nr:SDR family NAD(P)-dependent oxidoreductase [Flavitalea sp.]